MKNEQILHIINEEISASAIANHPHKVIKTTQHGNGYTVSVRTGHSRADSGFVEYSHPGITCTVYGITGEQKIRSVMRDYLARLA